MLMSTFTRGQRSHIIEYALFAEKLQECEKNVTIDRQNHPQNCLILNGSVHFFPSAFFN